MLYTMHIMSNYSKPNSLELEGEIVNTMAFIGGGKMADYDLFPISGASLSPAIRTPQRFTLSTTRLSTKRDQFQQYVVVHPSNGNG